MLPPWCLGALSPCTSPVGVIAVHGAAPAPAPALPPRCSQPHKQRVLELLVCSRACYTAGAVIRSCQVAGRPGGISALLAIALVHCCRHGSCWHTPFLRLGACTCWCAVSNGGGRQLPTAVAPARPSAAMRCAKLHSGAPAPPRSRPPSYRPAAESGHLSPRRIEALASPNMPSHLPVLAEHTITRPARHVVY